MNYVPIEKWGQDHWSTLAYLESVCTDCDGLIDPLKMRCNPDVHPDLAHGGSGKSSTYLANGEKLDNHDDWSCCEDFLHYGLIEWKDEEEGIIFLTISGAALAFMLRRARQLNMSWSEFTINQEQLDMYLSILKE